MIYQNRQSIPDGRWNFFWLCRYGLGFRLWLIEVQVYWYTPGGFSGWRSAAPTQQHKEEEKV